MSQKVPSLQKSKSNWLFSSVTSEDAFDLFLCESRTGALGQLHNQSEHSTVIWALKITYLPVSFRHVAAKTFTMQATASVETESMAWVIQHNNKNFLIFLMCLILHTKPYVHTYAEQTKCALQRPLHNQSYNHNITHNILAPLIKVAVTTKASNTIYFIEMKTFLGTSRTKPCFLYK